ncbi:MAG: DNA polymerase III subunit gamma/tau [Beggiatoa sp. IS2]|nr:MAG: DNA polymerase III subunit gamma/tau [Beggiatoa sp. IS2]
MVNPTYQVLARKWRPHNFSEIVGQEHVVRALINALKNKRLHHAYLFTGTRGVGKTTIARILAKSLNCETAGVTAQPCGQCAACREIDEGRFVDLLEVDAASRTKVEDTRELLENVQYAPARGRYKVYLIDEVHMLSNHSFNALLKTLEEPPPHVKFLLATTDPQKLPATILSRCLQFNLKRVPLASIIQQLTKIVTQEGVTHESQALRLLAQAADGSLRDALSLLDQAIAYGAGTLIDNDVKSMLGTLGQEVAIALVNTLATKDAPRLLQQIAELAEYNPDFTMLLGNMLSLWQRVAIAQLVPASVDSDQPDSEIIHQLAQQLSPEDVQLFYQIGLLGRRDLSLAPDPRGGFEMVLLRMLVFRPAAVAEQQLPKSPAPVMATQSTSPLATVAVTSLPSAKAPVDLATAPWAEIVRSLPLKGLVQQLAVNCELKQRKDNLWLLILPPAQKFLINKDKELERILQQHFGDAQRVQIRVEYPATDTPAEMQQRVRETREQAIAITVESDPFVVQLQEICEARITKVTTRSSEFE